MAWSDPGDFTSGQILTAAQMDSVREAMFLGQATFTNEAARDAAIPATGIALQEGMRAYLTAPTVPAATGGNTMLPSGITTVYNGSAWVCLTEVATLTTTQGTTTSSTFSPTLTSGGTNPSVTLVTGSTALITIAADIQVSTTSTVNVDVAVSGASTKPAGDYGNGIVVQRSDTGLAVTYSRTILIYSGLTAGTNTFTLNYSVNAGTATISKRSIIAKGVA
jgi:hypothetical protein